MSILDRSELERRLEESQDWAPILDELRDSPSLLAGPPPRALLEAIAHDEMPAGDAALAIARAWPRDEMSRAALAALRAERAPESRARLGRLVKHVLAAPHAADAIALCLDPSESSAVQSWLLGGLERLVLAGGLSWEDLSPVVEHLRRSTDPQIRVRLAGLLSALPWRRESRVLLEAMLDDTNAEVVVAAVQVWKAHLASLPRFDPQRLTRLRSHVNAWVRHATGELDDALSRPRIKP